ncbi:Nitrous oxidase accessory protein NosD, contains tandem CASH domains [Stigmatella aurantiaca]|uniref:Nitrous oxidase accessory protein NosD, contains tandem CASH domains n=1 Tax=Stigmatella aurantiaca TaxID=41 RepID=A0A1H8D035_STIAU|nr:right-handed parallel beta-helix repeat-containing protein [Stigmatella aurantiaca]SEN00582.1 Nitrous oxidase accessory protein NosD, contains tandem CASH domains [Stigmatella aurantiaca]
MRKSPAALLAACLLSASLWACQGGDSGSSDEGASQQAAGQPRTAAPGTGSSPESKTPSTGASSGSQTVPVGAQPVPDTPVADLPAHEGHAPIAQPSPQPDAPSAEPTPPPAKFTREWVVSPSGSDTAAGTAAQPFKTIGKATSMAGPGELIRVLAGTYAERVVLDASVKAGTAEAKITLQGEGKPRITPGPGTGGLVQVRRPNWVIDGFDIDVKGEAAFAVTFEGDVRGSVLANSELHHGKGGGAVTTYGKATGAIIENNHIHDFVKNQGDFDSHGVVVQPTSVDITVRNNDIHDNSGDSVQCLGPEGFSSLPPAKGLTVENNHFYSNRENAVDIKTCHDVVVRNNRMHGFKPSATAKGDALVVHYSAKNVLIEGNEVYDSGKGISVGGNREGPVPSGVIIRRNRVHDITKEGGGEGAGIRLENSEGTHVVNNTITRVDAAALTLGHGTGGPTSNVTVENNIIDAAVAVDLGGQHPGMTLGFNLYPADAQFKLSTGAVGMDAFQQASGDQSSTLADQAVTQDFSPAQPAVDKGTDVGLPFCGVAPDIGAVEADC